MSDELPVKSGSNGLVDRAKGILVDPKKEWAVIAGEATEPMKVFTTYALPLILIGPIATFLGILAFGYGVGIQLGIGVAIGMAVMALVTSVLGLFVVAFAANILSPQFGGRNDFPAAFRLVAYSWTAIWLGGIFALVPMLAMLGWLVGLYSLYLLYLGAGPVMGVPEEKSVGYVVVTILAVIVVQIVFYFVAAMITASMFLATAGAIAY